MSRLDKVKNCNFNIYAHSRQVAIYIHFEIKALQNTQKTLLKALYSISIIFLDFDKKKLNKQKFFLSSHVKDGIEAKKHTYFG